MMYWIGYYCFLVVVLLFVDLLLVRRYCYHLLLVLVGTNYVIKFLVVVLVPKVAFYEIAKVNFLTMELYILHSKKNVNRVWGVVLLGFGVVVGVVAWIVFVEDFDDIVVVAHVIYGVMLI